MASFFHRAILPSQLTEEISFSKTKDEQKAKTGFLAIQTYFAGGIYIGGLPTTTIHGRVTLIFTYIIPAHKMTL